MFKNRCVFAIDLLNNDNNNNNDNNINNNNNNKAHLKLTMNKLYMNKLTEQAFWKLWKVVPRSHSCLHLQNEIGKVIWVSDYWLIKVANKLI